MPEKNEQLTAHIFHLSQCTGVAGRTIAELLRAEKRKRSSSPQIKRPTITYLPTSKKAKQDKRFKKSDEFVKDFIKKKIYQHHKNNTVCVLFC